MERQDFLQFILEKAKNNKYTKWYIELCISRSTNKKIKGYTENHHIVPRSIKKEWKTEMNNSVHFTFKEHFVAHLLLRKMFDNIWHEKMIYALSFMIFGKNIKYIVPSRLFIKMKEDFSILNSMKNTNAKRKVSLALTGRTKDTHEYIRLSAIKGSETRKNSIIFKESRKKWKEHIYALTTEERKILFKHKTEFIASEKQNEFYNSLRGNTKETSENIKKRVESFNNNIAKMTKEERLQRFSTTKDNKWYYNKETLENKSFKKEEYIDETIWLPGMYRNFKWYYDKYSLQSFQVFEGTVIKDDWILGRPYKTRKNKNENKEN
jgi:hypothetical protein